MKFFGRIVAVTRKELRQISRDRRTLLILLFVPAFFLFVYGYALNFDIRNIALAVEDNDQSVQSRQLVSAFVRSGYFDLVAAVTDDREVVRLLDTGGALAVLVIPARFGERASTGQRASVQVLINGDNANTDQLHTICRSWRTIVFGGTTTVAIAGKQPPAAAINV